MCLAIHLGFALTVTWPVLAQENGLQVEFETDRGTRMNADFSPDGDTIVFDLLGAVYSMPADGGQATRLTGPDSVNYRPRFSPTGDRIAFLSDRSGTLNVWVMNADGSNPINVTGQDAVERPKRYRFFITPEWTNNGKYTQILSV